jgi:molybdate transport system ATP-binding protein
MGLAPRRPQDCRTMTLSVQLQHRFPGLTLDMAFDAPAGVTALFGRSGSGKTTLAHALAGLFRPDHARIALGDRLLADSQSNLHLPPHQRRLGLVFQDGRLFPHLTVAQNLTYGQRFAPKGTPLPQLDKIARLLDITTLLPRRPAHLSGGERQRVAIGRALLSAPQMLILDEPLSALDLARKQDILPYLERLRDESQMPMLYISHALDEVARLANTLVLVDQGRIRAAGPVETLLSDPDLAPALGLRQAGAVVTARITAHHLDGLTEAELTGAGPILLPRLPGEPGSPVRLRIAAQDVILSRTRPDGLSALNILPATVTRLRRGDGPGVMVQLQLGESLILCRLTARSATALQLEPGTPCHAILKSLSVTA